MGSSVDSSDLTCLRLKMIKKNIYIYADHVQTSLPYLSNQR
jgi:hypothetical protein